MSKRMEIPFAIVLGFAFFLSGCGLNQPPRQEQPAEAVPNERIVIKLPSGTAMQPTPLPSSSPTPVSESSPAPSPEAPAAAPSPSPTPQPKPSPSPTQKPQAAGDEGGGANASPPSPPSIYDLLPSGTYVYAPDPLRWEMKLYNFGGYIETTIYEPNSGFVSSGVQTLLAPNGNYQGYLDQYYTSIGCVTRYYTNAFILSAGYVRIYLQGTDGTCGVGRAPSGFFDIQLLQ